MKKGAYGRERKEVLRLVSEVERGQRLQQIEEERRRQHKLIGNLRQTSPMKDAVKPKERKLTKIIEMRASYYEAELLKELKIRRADVDAAEPAVAIYKEFQPVHRPARTENGHFATSPRPKARKPQSESYSSAQKPSHRGQSKSFSSPMAPVSEDALEHSIAKAQEQADAVESRRQRILEKAIQDLDQKLARFAHRRTFSVTPKLAKRV